MQWGGSMKPGKGEKVLLVYRVPESSAVQLPPGRHKLAEGEARANHRQQECHMCKATALGVVDGGRRGRGEPAAARDKVGTNRDKLHNPSAFHYQVNSLGVSWNNCGFSIRPRFRSRNVFNQIGPGFSGELQCHP